MNEQEFRKQDLTGKGDFTPSKKLQWLIKAKALSIAHRQDMSKTGCAIEMQYQDGIVDFIDNTAPALLAKIDRLTAALRDISEGNYPHASTLAADNDWLNAYAELQWLARTALEETI